MNKAKSKKCDDMYLESLDREIKVKMRLADDYDNEFLVMLKNKNKQFFFYQKEISLAEQRNWFQGYLVRENDYMFVILVKEQYAGCMGIRLADNGWDIYNVMLGDITLKGSGVMSLAFQKMLTFACEKKKVFCSLKVLKINPAIQWYKKQGFKIVEEFDVYLIMKYELSNIHKGKE